MNGIMEGVGCVLMVGGIWAWWLMMYGDVLKELKGLRMMICWKELFGEKDDVGVFWSNLNKKVLRHARKDVEGIGLLFCLKRLLE